MSKKAPWPIHKMFRSQPPNEFNHQRSPSPIVEMPLSPDPESANGSCMSPRYPSSMERSLSPRRSQSPFNSGPNKFVREIPIEVEHEVTRKKTDDLRFFIAVPKLSLIFFLSARNLVALMYIVLSFYFMHINLKRDTIYFI